MTNKVVSISPQDEGRAGRCYTIDELAELWQIPARDLRLRFKNEQPVLQRGKPAYPKSAIRRIYEGLGTPAA